MQLYSTEQLNSILERGDVFLIPVLSDHKLHWSKNRLSFIYGVDLKTNEEFLFNVNHYDFTGLIFDFRGDLGKGVYVYNAKYLNAQITFYEAKLVIWECSGKVEKFELPRNLELIYSRNKDQSNLNDIFPILLWIDWCRKIRIQFIQCLKQNPNLLLNYNQFATDLSVVERNGFYSDTGLQFTEYNPFTITGRPSNNYNGINYAALNKTDGTRKQFKSRFDRGFLLEVDLTAYHPTLLSKILGIEVNEFGIYEKLKMDHWKDLTIEEIKVKTFQCIYGGIPNELESIEFFQKIKQLSKKLYNQFNIENGQIETFFYKKTIKRSVFSKFNELTLFNYLIQNLETENNFDFLRNLNELLKDKESKVVLYTYDSFLIDFSANDGKTTILQILDIFKDFPFKLKVGANYQDMKRKNIKNDLRFSV